MTRRGCGFPDAAHKPPGAWLAASTPDVSDGPDILKRAQRRLDATVACIKQSRALVSKTQRLIQRTCVRRVEHDARHTALKGGPPKALLNLPRSA